MEHTRQQVAATNHFVCTGEFLQKFLSPQQNFVIASSRTESVRLNLCNILRQQNSVAETKIFAEILQYTQSDLLLWLGALHLLPNLYTRDDFSPRSVAGTCIVCSDLWGLSRLISSLYLFQRKRNQA